MNHPAPDPHPRPEPRRVLIGTAGSVRALADQLSSLGDESASVIGAVIIDGSTLPPSGGGTPPVLGGVADLADILRRTGATDAIVSIPAALRGVAARVHATLAAQRVHQRIVPTITDLLADTSLGTRAGTPRLDFASLIGREPRRLDDDRARDLLGGKCVLITGAGGSIGSELARRCAALGAGELILMERAENALFEIDRQIAARFPSLRRRAVLHDVVDAEATLRRFVALTPRIVFHAAAHKHVPMMEDHPAAAVTNNLFGTKSVADAARAVNAERFVMISTDKAVNPTSVMGATKRLAEIYVRSLNADHASPAPPAGAGTRFSLVRFGNVLGSACSVLPIWTRQIDEGGPVTVTHPDMTRYFMTIPEAAALVVQSATLEDPGVDVLVLDMGEPVRIRDLADRFVRAHGLCPKWPQAPGGTDTSAPNDVRVVFTGIRPGEKLHEELAYSAEELAPTQVPGVCAWRGPRPEPSAVAIMVAEMSGIRHSDTPHLVVDRLWNTLRTVEAAATRTEVANAA